MMLVQEVGRRATVITGDSSSYQWLCKWVNTAISFQKMVAACC